MEEVMVHKNDRDSLQSWYLKQKRDLPWRNRSDPYAIWLSEVMLQQTTSEAVKGHFQRFLEALPTVKDLALAPEEQVLELWSGLGYYSRARNIHRAARKIHHESHFPQTHSELLNYPGFGPYTARSVASLAFGESVGVLDGNVIRILCRRFGLSLPWWKTSGRDTLQSLADQMVEGKDSAVLNQAMMDLGATVCLPKSPKCVLCPWIESCQALKSDEVENLPLRKPKREFENWVWYPQLHRKRGRLALVTNTYAPFLKGQWFLPGKVRRQSQAPKTFDYRHSITHHRIFVKIQVSSINLEELSSDTTIKWVRESELARWTPSSLVHKAVRISPL